MVICLRESKVSKKLATIDFHGDEIIAFWEKKYIPKCLGSISIPKYTKEALEYALERLLAERKVVRQQELVQA